MSNQIYSQFLTIEYLKHSLKITDATQDDKIVEIMDRSNEQVDNDIHPYIDTPVPTGDPIFSHGRSLALRFAKQIWADEVLNDLEKVKVYTDLYDSKLQSVISELKSNKNNRTKTILVAKDVKKFPISTKDVIGLSLNY